MKTHNLYIQTIGCQMNVYDADRMAGLLRSLHYRRIDTPEHADLIIVNTCAIRAKAEQKVFSYLGRLSKLKQKNPALLIAVGGCVAQQEGARIIDRVPSVDLVFGTHAIGRLPENIQRVKTEKRRVVDVDMLPAIDEAGVMTDGGHKGVVSRFVTIMQGCDNYCTYCVVPHVRGREVSRDPDSIVCEVERLVASGVREVVLLGQNVNSYGVKQGACSFPELLGRVDAIDGLLRIRFTTSHPKDLSDDLVQAFGALDKLCHHIHLPVQSGANRVLKKMNRRYTRELYLEKVDKLRRQCPDIAITSDFIVGFPGETDAEFEETLDLIRTVDFDSLFAFMYSDRPSAPAVRLADKIPESVKNDRLKALLGLQDTRIARKNESLIGSVQTVLVEGTSKKQATEAHFGRDREPQWTGRTSGHKIVNFSCGTGHGRFPAMGKGSLVAVKIEKAFAHSLRGRPVDAIAGSPGLKGASYAA